LKANLPKAPPAELERQIPDVTCVAFSPDGRLIFIGDTQGICHLLDAGTGEPARPAFSGHREIINAAVFTPDSRLLLTASDDGTVLTWDVESGQRVGNALVHTMSLRGKSGTAELQAPVKQLALIQDEQGRSVIYTAAPNEVEVEDNRPTRPTSMRVRRWLVGSDTPTASIDIACDRINSLAFSEGMDETATMLLACSQQRSDFLLRWDAVAGQGGRAPQARKAWNDNLDRGAIAWAIFASGSKPGILTVGGKGARLWSRDEGRRVLSYRPHAAVRAVDVAPTNVTAEPIGADPGGSHLLKVSLDDAPAAGRTLFVLTAGDDNSAKIWQCQLGEDGQVEAFRAIARFDWGIPGDPAQRGHTQPINSAQFFVEGDQLLVLTAADDGTAKIWHQRPDNPASAHNGHWEVRTTFGGHQGRVHAATISPDCRYLATAGDDGVAKLWRVPGPDEADPTAPLAETQPFREAVLCLAFSPDCRWLATGGGDFIGRVWQIGPQEGVLREVGEMRGHSGAVHGVTFAADSHRLVTASDDKSIRVWNTFPLWTASDATEPPGEDSPATAAIRLQEVLSLTGHKRGVNSIAFTPDGRSLLSSSDDGRAMVWLGEFVEPSIRLSDLATRYQEGGIAVDPQLLVTEPSRIQGQTPAASYEVVVSIRTEAGEAIPSASDERLSLNTEDQVLQLQGGELGPWQVLWQDPATGELRRVGELFRQNSTLRLQLHPEANNWSLQAALRRILYHHDGQRTVDTTRQIRYEMRKNDQTLTADFKVVSIDANAAKVDAPQDPPATASE
jgi:WD40 repeat protein